MMKGAPPPVSAAAYMASLRGWQKTLVPPIRTAIKRAARLEEAIKWGHLVYITDGPVLLLRVEPQRVLLGFWRGQRMRDLEPRLKPGGKYEMANIVLREGDKISAIQVRRLVRRAVELTEELGDPTDLKSAKAKSPSKRTAGTTRRRA